MGSNIVIRRFYEINESDFMTNIKKIIKNDSDSNELIYTDDYACIRETYVH